MTDLTSAEPVDAPGAADVDSSGPAPVEAGMAGRVTRRVRRTTLPQVVLLAGVALYVAHYTQRSIDIHHSLGTSTYDSALYDQGVWLLSRFETPFVTLMGRNLFGDHTSIALVFLVPVYWVFPAAGTLFFAQSAAIGAGAIPVFLYGRKRLGSEWLALVGAAAYLLHPAVGWTNLENFHPDAFLGVFVAFAIYAALEERWRMYVVFVVLSLLVKEDASLVIVPLGIWVALKRNRRIGLLTILGSVAFMLVAMFLVMRSLIGVPTRNGWRIPFGGPRGVIDTALTNPTQLVDHLRDDGRPWYLWQMTAPFAWLFLRAPSVALISSLVLFTNVLSTFWYQYQIQYHYSLVAVPALSMGTVYAIGAIRDRGSGGGSSATGSMPRRPIPRRRVAVGLLGVATLVTAYLWAPVPWGRTPQYYGDPNNQWATAARELWDEIPGDAVVAAHYRITPHLAHRTEIYQFPTPFRSVLYGPNGNLDGPRIDDRAERVEWVMIPTSQDETLQRDWAAVADAFDLVDVNDIWLLYQRDFETPLPPP
jgi:uncharacterized membrane protein